MANTYETYKESNVEWLGRIPSTWTIEKGKHVLHVLSKPVQNDDEVITCFRDGEVVLRSERRTEGFTMSDKEIGYQKERPLTPSHHARSRTTSQSTGWRQSQRWDSLSENHERLTL